MKCLINEGTIIGERALMVQENIKNTQVSLLGVGGHHTDSGESLWCRRTSNRFRLVFYLLLLAQDNIAKIHVSFYAKQNIERN